MIDIEKARAIIAASTPGPWEALNKEDCWRVYGSRYPIARVTLSYATPATDALDAEFIAFARTALPEALDEIERIDRVHALQINILDAANVKLAKESEALKSRLALAEKVCETAEWCRETDETSGYIYEDLKAWRNQVPANPMNEILGPFGSPREGK